MAGTLVIEVTLDGVLNYVETFDPITSAATFTTNKSHALEFPESEIDDVIVHISAVDSAFSGGNPTSTPPKPF